MMQASRATFRALLVVLASAGFASVSEAQERMRPGLWEVTNEMTPARPGMAGMPGMGGPQQRCISEAEAAQANGTAAQVRAALMAEAKDCTFDDVKAEGDRVSYRQTCGECKHPRCGRRRCKHPRCGRRQRAAPGLSS